ncbi:MAG: VOC family protein [Burkholderiaceae bacterium]|nr:VOC family protein [Burkholderiaceae bacterium]
MTTDIDHLIIAADTLEAGAAWCEAALGVLPGPGGQHPLMGTHNRLLNLSSPAFPRCYLEIIAIDPDAPPPGRARWFGLDERPPGPPALWHVVARSTMLDMHRWGLIHKQADPGLPLAASRGDFRWQILVRDDGRRTGVLPTLIQWDGPHPADRLPVSGLQLRSLRLDGLPTAQRDVLRLRGVGGDPAAAPRLTAVFDTPRGGVTLQTP